MLQTPPSFGKKLDRNLDVNEEEPLELKAKINGSPKPIVSNSLNKSYIAILINVFIRLNGSKTENLCQLEMTTLKPVYYPMVL